MRELIAFVGPVHSEKSTRAARSAGRYRRLGHRVVLIRPRRSVRAHERAGTLVTKNGAEFPSVEIDSAAEIEPTVRSTAADVVWLDEPMLFADETLVFEQVQKIRLESIVLVSGLSATSELEVFGSSMSKLLAVADEVVHCRADCDKCLKYGAATRSVCLRQKTGQVLVGGEDAYKALCPSCWTFRVQTDATASAALT